MYFFQGMREPGGERVLAQTPVIETAPATEERTCEGYGAGPYATSQPTEGGE